MLGTKSAISALTRRLLMENIAHLVLTDVRHLYFNALRADIILCFG